MKTVLHRAAGLFTALMFMVGAFVPALPVKASVELQTATQNITINSGNSTTVVHFAGYEWYAIGYDGNGVYSETGDNSVTLLAKNEDFGTARYREYTDTDPQDDTYIRMDWYWYKHYGEESFDKPADYYGSSIQHRMETIAEEFRVTSWREYDMIRARTLISDNERFNMSGADVENQKLWVLDYPEWVAINKDVEILQFQQHWWARGTSPYDNNTAMVGHREGNQAHVYFVGSEYLVRPALSLSLENVLFASAAIGTNTKSSVAVGAGLVEADTLTGTDIKFTVVDETMATPRLEILTEGAAALSFGYEGAQTGQDHYVSMVVTPRNSDEVLYYAKVADCTASDNGSFTIDLSMLSAGDYILKIFTEQANGDSFTDFASEPYNVPVTVAVNGDTSVEVTPGITSQPTGAAYLQGGPAAALTVATSMNFGTLSYQWYSNSTDGYAGSTPIANATGASYTPDTSALGTTYYFVQITNTIAEKTAIAKSNRAMVVVEAPVDAALPTIVTQPKSSTAYAVGTAPQSLEVKAAVADGGSLTYQWYTVSDAGYTNPVAIPQATGAAYTPPTGAVGTYYYYVEVTNENPSATGQKTASTNSNVATVTVADAPEPELPPITFTGLPAGNTVRVGEPFTLTPSEDGQRGSTGWKWDSEFFSATFNSPATFTALKAGTSTITYTAPDGRTTSVTITLLAAEGSPAPTPSPETGDGSMVWLYALLAAAAALAGGLVWHKRSRLEP